MARPKKDNPKVSMHVRLEPNTLNDLKMIAQRDETHVAKLIDKALLKFVLENK